MSLLLPKAENQSETERKYPELMPFSMRFKGITWVAWKSWQFFTFVCFYLLRHTLQICRGISRAERVAADIQACLCLHSSRMRIAIVGGMQSSYLNKLPSQHACTEGGIFFPLHFNTHHLFIYSLNLCFYSKEILLQ